MILPWDTLELLQRSCKWHLQRGLGGYVSFLGSDNTNRCFVLCVSFSCIEKGYIKKRWHFWLGSKKRRTGIIHSIRTAIDS